MNRLIGTVACGLVFAAATALDVRAQEKKYVAFDDAYSEAARLQRRGEPATALIGPLEAALKLAQDDTQRRRAYEALVAGYRQLPEMDKLLTAQEFIIRHTDRRAGRSLTAQSLAVFAVD